MNRFSFIPSLPLLGWSGLFWGLTATLGQSVQADMPLTRADVESLYNQVDFIADGQAARPANLNDWLSLGDALRTSLGARAELRFNDGSLARVGERATFWFVPNTRDFRLSNGTALFLIPPGRGPSNIQTPSAVTGIQGTALVVRHIPRPDCDQTLQPADELACPGRTVVMVLTDSPKGPVEVSTESGNTAALSAGDLAVIENGAIQVLEFNLQLFYETSPLVEGLNLNNPDFAGTGSPTDPVRQETWDGIESQEGFAGNYLLNPDVISLDAQLGVSTSWLLPADDSTSAFPVNAMTDRVADINAVSDQRSPRSAGVRSLMSSWFANTSSSPATSPQAAIPGGIIRPPVERRPGGGMGTVAPVSAPTRPVTAGGGKPAAAGSTPPRTAQPSVPTPSPSGTPSAPVPVQPGGGGQMPGQPTVESPPPTQPSGPVGGGPTPTPAPTGPVEPPGGIPGGPTVPEVPFDPGGAPTQPGPVEPPVEQPVLPPNDTFAPPGNPDPTGDPNFTPPGEPAQPPGVPFDPGGGPATPAPAPEPTGGAPIGGPTIPAPEAAPIAPPVEPLPEAAAPNEFPGDVLLPAPEPEGESAPPAGETPTGEPPAGEAPTGEPPAGEAPAGEPTVPE